MLLLPVHRRRSPCHRGSLRVPAASGGAAAAAARTWACETERAQGGPCSCVGPCGLWAGWVR
jgi:hypothetical protein